MSDIAIVLDPRELAGDWALSGNDLAAGDDLKTAILISLLTETGWWADAFEGSPIGSRLLELRRAKRTNDTRLRARDHCRSALKWLIEDGVAKSVAVETEWRRDGRLAIGIEVAKPAGGVERFSWVWDAV